MTSLVKTPLSISLCLIALALAGCQDDSSNTISSSTDKNKDACSPDDASSCTDGRVCEGGKCVLKVGLGAECNGTDILCSTGKCENGICKENNQNDPLPSVGEPCTNEKGCAGDAICSNNVCIDAPLPNVGEPCTNEKGCAGDAICSNNVCIDAPLPNIGEPCTNEKGCAGDAICSNNVCIEDPRPDVGEPCTNEIGCAGDAICSYNVCILENLTDGAECDDDIRYCALEWTCENNHCTQTVYTGEECNEYKLCQNEDICFAGKCITNIGCTSDNECQNDSYCCLEDACSTKNICISYGQDGPRGDKDEKCEYQTVPGMFEAAIQCEWKTPAAGDPYPGHANVLVTPLVVNTPHDSGKANEIVFVTYNSNDGDARSGQGTDVNLYGVIRIINAETCALHESIFDDNNHIIGGDNPAAADVDNDGKVEIFAGRGVAQRSGAGGGIVAFHWVDPDPTAAPGTPAAKGHYATWWKTDKASSGVDQNLNWGGPAIHDINDDGIPEIIGYGGEVFNALTGKRLNDGQTLPELYYTPTLGDFDYDGNVEIIGTVNIYRWNKKTNIWDKAYSKPTSTGLHPAFADFGTRKSDGSFDPNTLDGRAEIVNCGSGIVQITTLEGENILRVTNLAGGGPCTIGDFDGDGLPEVATAFGDSYRIFDPRCHSSADGCAKPYILWEKLSQDASSSSTGSSLFDFDGDGSMEAVYADECYTRVYDGKTGDVLFSAYRSSATWHEYPVIADVDNDESAEIVVGSNNAMGCPTLDPIHRGLRCQTNADCKSLSCINGFCRCTNNNQCNSRTDMHGNILDEYACVAGITTADQVGGNVCRAKRNNAERVTGVRVMRDSLDRWTSSRNLWNQHAYSITNVNNDMTIPRTSEWVQNFRHTDPIYNNFRQNTQGARGRNVAPDITGRFTNENACSQTEGGTVTFGAEICNRGTKMVASLMPASFYLLNQDGSKTHLCTSYTSENVPIGGCLRVTCDVEHAQNFLGQEILMIANDDGKGGRTTVECNDQNNTDKTTITSCPIL